MSNETRSETITGRRRNYGAVSNEPTEYRETNSSSTTISATANISPSDQHRSTLSFIQKMGFGLGHIYNDLCAGVWFSYTLLFMQDVLLLPAIVAGALVMLGQVCDALATPVIGILTDRFGTKRQWHIFGTFLVFITFPMIFSLCPWCAVTPEWWPIVYFAFFIVLFQFAWPTVQITHLAMIPELSITNKDRTDLTATRYSASVCSNVIVFVITWAALKSRKDQTPTNRNMIGPNDAFRFRDISLILTLIGVTMSVLFHFSLALSGYERRRSLAVNQNAAHSNSPNADDIDETKRLIDSGSKEEESHTVIINNEMNQNRNKNFLKSPRLYQNALLYVFARLFMTTSLIYMPLWLEERSWAPNNKLPTITETTSNSSLMLDNVFILAEVDATIAVEHLATVPLVSFLAAFIASVLLKYSDRIIGHQVAYLIGSSLCIGGCVWIALSASDSFTSITLYLIAILFGSGSSVTMISSLCLIARMIGSHTNQGGFIYSAVTFCDKLITGIVIVIIESLKCKNRSDCPEYYKIILSGGCGIAAICGILILITLQCNKRRNESETNLNRRISI